MATIIEMPKLSDTMEEGAIASWLKKEGDVVEEGEPLVEIETDKSTIEYASPEDGTLLKILVQGGTSSPLRAPIAVIGEKGESFDLTKIIKAETNIKKPEKEDVKLTSPKNQKDTKEEKSSRVKASPLAKRLAQEKGLDLNQLNGSGPNGRIIAKDIEKSSPTNPLTQESDISLPVDMMRKTIAKRLVAAKNEAPHFYLSVSANMENVLKWRKSLNSQLKPEDEKTLKVSINDLLILLTAKAIKKHSIVNSSWQKDSIIQRGSINIAFAVALPSGLITPTIFAADKINIREISRQSKELVKKAYAGALAPQEYNGGSFTISNLGMTKVEEFTAIINPPQSCILAVGCTKKVPYVSEYGNIEAQERVKMTLSCDHRVVDGMSGAKFLETLISYIENPMLLLS